MVVLEAAAIGAAGYGVYRGGEAVARKGQATLTEHRRESHRRGQRKELEHKTKERKDRLAQLASMRGGGGAASTKQRTIITTSHPSPLGATKTTSPFLGSKCFSRANKALVEMGMEPIDWNVDRERVEV